MKEVYYNSGLESLPDHTVFELLLYFGIPMKDTNEIAHRLLQTFGSFSGVLSADRKDLKNVPGMTENAACLISMLLPIFKRYSDDVASNTGILKTVDDVVSYIRPKFLDSKNERVFAIFTDSSSKIICSRMLGEGDLSSTEFDFRALVSAALETKAKNVILVHNHPSSFAVPSVRDVELTKRIASFLLTINICLSDHIIIGENDYMSMAATTAFKDIF